MQAQPQHQKRPDSFGGCSRVAILIRHPLQDLLGDLSIFSKRTVCLQYAHDRLERIAMHTHNPLDFFRSIGGMAVKILTCAVPISLRSRDLLCGDQSVDRPHVA
ncbi:hypothetical protein RHAB21_03252 [Pseudorhizobium halotolerans]|uniref:Uncharacterized protein n=1 Tax=Pseudorhizobium halotolerans TaxID=1233081 RepID=A0ABN7JTR8_9HYPH|nr:hypothetical protein RHAB21_03252 [Pseudorhizobium halotolerans]